MQHSRVQHSTKSRFLDRQPTELLYTTNIGQQGTGWTVVNQEANFKNCVSNLRATLFFVTLHALSGVHNGLLLQLWWGLRFAFDHRSYVYPALHLLTVQCPGWFVCNTQILIVLAHPCKGFVEFAACISLCILMLCQQRMLQLASGSNCSACCINCVVAHVVAPPKVDAKLKLCGRRLSPYRAACLVHSCKAYFNSSHNLGDSGTESSNLCQPLP